MAVSLETGIRTYDLKKEPTPAVVSVMQYCQSGLDPKEECLKRVGSVEEAIEYFRQDTIKSLEHDPETVPTESYTHERFSAWHNGDDPYWYADDLVLVVKNDVAFIPVCELEDGCSRHIYITEDGSPEGLSGVPLVKLARSEQQD